MCTWLILFQNLQGSAINVVGGGKERKSDTLIFLHILCIEEQGSLLAIISRVFNCLLASFGPSHCREKFSVDIVGRNMFVHRLPHYKARNSLACTNSPTMPELMETSVFFRELLCFLFGSAHCFALSWQRISQGAAEITLPLIVPLEDKSCYLENIKHCFFSTSSTTLIMLLPVFFTHANSGPEGQKKWRL